MCGDGFGFESGYVYEFGGGGAGEGCWELGVVGLRKVDGILGRRDDVYSYYGRGSAAVKWDE
jgi:hypothetical protein